MVVYFGCEDKKWLNELKAVLGKILILIGSSEKVVLEIEMDTSRDKIIAREMQRKALDVELSPEEIELLKTVCARKTKYKLTPAEEEVVQKTYSLWELFSRFGII